MSKDNLTSSQVDAVTHAYVDLLGSNDVLSMYECAYATDELVSAIKLTLVELTTEFPWLIG